LLLACNTTHQSVGPDIYFTLVPLTDKGGHDKMGTIEGRVTAAPPEHQVVLYARSGMWYVQPFANQSFTKIQADSHWQNTTHLGTEYAALLVAPGYIPPIATEALPQVGGPVVAVAVTPGVPHFWQTWWFRLSLVLAGLFAILTYYRWRLHQLSKQLHLRFEERLAERTRIAQDLHDTLLQGFLSASMQLHVAADQLPDDSPAKPTVNRVLELMAQVTEEGRNALRGLRSSNRESHDLAEAFSRIQQELTLTEAVDFRILVEGSAQPLHPVIRDEVYRVGREALVNALLHARAKKIEVELEFAMRHLRVLVRDDGCGIDPAVLQSGRDGHWGLSGMRERAENIGGKLKVWSRAGAGTEVELSIPSHIAFESHNPSQARRWAARLLHQKAVIPDPGSEQVK
jgi:signal transduction histidine kinase